MQMAYTKFPTALCVVYQNFWLSAYAFMALKNGLIVYKYGGKCDGF